MGFKQHISRTWQMIEQQVNDVPFRPDNEADRPVSNPRAPRRQSTVMGDGLYAKYYIGYANRRGSYEPRRFMLSLLLHPDSHRNLQAVSRLFRYRTFFFHSFYYFPNR